MKTSPSSGDAFNIVAVGFWNAAIFSPEWAKANLSDNQDREVVLAIPMQLALPSRLTVDEVNIYPSAQSLLLDCVNYSEDGIVACVRKFQKIAQLLPHTPTTAIGVNFRYVGDLHESGMLASLFAFSDAGRIDAGAYSLIGTSLRRTFLLPDGTNLNLNLDSQPERLRVEFNFHLDVPTLAQAVEKVTVERIQQLQTNAVNFLSTVYQIELED